MLAKDLECALHPPDRRDLSAELDKARALRPSDYHGRS
jgi:hypothetical protein